VTAKNVGGRQFRGNPLLPGVDDLGPRGDLGNPLDVLLLNGITKDNPHHAAS
jgi:hypothetical protein